MKNISSFLFLVFCALHVGLGVNGLYATESAPFYWDNRPVKLMTGIMRVSPTADGEATGEFQVDGSAAAGWTAESPLWDTSAVEDGQHELALAGTEADYTATALVLNEGIQVHGGVLESDEVWSADKIHVVRTWVRIPEGMRLVIPNGAVVKFCRNTGILNNGMLSAMSATLTAFEDDTVGGDTNLDEDMTSPAEESYAIVNNGTLTAVNCSMAYATSDSVFETTAVAIGAFQGCTELTEVAFPAYVTYIGANAFQGCENLTGVSFMGAPALEDDTTFDGCGVLQDVYFLNGLPVELYTFGDASPVVHLNSSHFVPETWNDYAVVDDADIRADELSERLDKLTAQMDALQAILNSGEEWQVLTKTGDGGYAWMDSDAMGQEVMTLNLVTGWNCVAMPGRVVLDPSSEALLKNIVIYTFDPKTQTFTKADGLKPLNSYWMRAQEPCTIHFLVADEKPEEE